MQKLTHFKLLAILATFSATSLLPAYAQDKKEEPKKEEPKRDQKAIDYEKAIKDLPKIEGAFTFYQRKKELLLELPEDKLGKLFFLQATMHTGWSTTFQQGLPVPSAGLDSYQAVDVYRLEKKSDERVWLTRPNLKFRWDKDHPLATAIERTFPQAFLADYRIEQYNPEKKTYLINATNLFTGELFKLTETLNQMGGMQLIPDREKSGPDSVKGFPENNTVRMDLYYNANASAGGNPFAALLAALGGGGNNLEDARSVNFKVTYSMFYRKDSDYKPRLMDPRVGYFTQDFTDFGRYYRDDRTTRFINRWNLKKKDPNSPMSEAVKPIVWTIDHSVPVEYRDAAKRGILMWNKAFEKLGYKNAVQVQDAPKEGYDHADGRYNVYRWTVTNGFDGAIALMRTDPFTGEVMSSGINFDATFVYAGNRNHELLVIPNSTTMMNLAKVAVSQDPHDHATCTAVENAMWKPQRLVADAIASGFKKTGWAHAKCSFNHDRATRFEADLLRIQANVGGISRKEVVEQFVADITAHEVGHTFGLRHNFIASTNLTTKELQNAALVKEQGTTASIMDYTDINMAAVLNGGGQYFNGTIGSYDIHAIRYGYMDVKADTPEGERFALSQVAKLQGQRGLEFMTDEDADGFDPRVVRFDGARDPLNYLAASFAVEKKSLAYILKNYPKPGESYAARNSFILGGLRRIFSNAADASRFVGGMNGSRAMKGDGGERANLAPVSAAEQRQAMKLITDACFSEKAFDLPESVLTSMALDYATGSGSGWTAPIRSQISGQQTGILGSLLSSGRVNRIAENAFKLKEAPGTYSVAEHYRLVCEPIFKGITQRQNFPTLTRDLQRSLVDLLITQAGSSSMVNSEAKAIANVWLSGIADMAKQYERTNANEMTQMHMAGLHETIKRFQNRQSVEGNFGGGGGGGFDLSSLFGRLP